MVVTAPLPIKDPFMVMSPLPVSLNFELANKILPPQQPPQALPPANA